MKFFPYSLIALFLIPCCAAFGQVTKEQLRNGVAAAKPLQSDVDIDTIANEEIPLCDVVVSEDARQVRLLSPQKVVLRHFVDTDGDAQRQIDQWSY
jgi:hypothetical protein